MRPYIYTYRHTHTYVRVNMIIDKHKRLEGNRGTGHRGFR
jgi:hypothetical protein